MSRPDPRLIILAFAAALSLAACGQHSSPKGAPPASSAPAAMTLRPDQAQLLLQALTDAPAEGFRPDAFGGADLKARLGSADPAARALAQQALVQATLAYAQAMHGLAIPAREEPKEWALRPPPYDAAADLRQALEQNRLKDWLGSLAPASPRYAALRTAYQTYQKIVAAGGWPQLSDDGALRRGDQGDRVADLRRRLAIEDPALANAPDDDGFDDQVAAAVQRAQTRYGLTPTGIADSELITALNEPAETRVAQIRANLERLRRMPRDPEPTRIEVNTAAQTLVLYEDGAPALDMLAVAGRPNDQTPMLSSAIEAVQFNPAWHVPNGIARKELFPKARRNHGYFAREGFVMRDGRLVQKPGPKNALGQVKFEFPNPFQVYLHDTPARAAFASAHRTVSHGCVRLQRALDLARRLLSDRSDWPPERIDTTLATRSTTTVRLPHPVPVGLYYLTAFPNPDGTVSFREDVYGWDTQLLRLLDAEHLGRA